VTAWKRAWASINIKSSPNAGVMLLVRLAGVVRCIATSVCLSVCLSVSVRSRISETMHALKLSPDFQRTLPTVVVRSCCGGVVIRCVFPVTDRLTVCH